MNYLQFRQALLPFGIFSTRDVVKLFPDFDARRLFEWQQKGFLHKLINKWYLFAELPINEKLLYRISNCLCRPSYVSLESALSYYNLIPEGVYSQQAITTRKTTSYETPAGVFNYRSIKPSYFFGYRILREGQSPILIAEAEKALLDYLYFHATLNTVKDIEALRLNYDFLQKDVDWKKLEKYALVFNSKTLDQRIGYLKKSLPYAHTF